MRQDFNKIKKAIKEVRYGKFDLCVDVRLYATYLYAVRSHSRGRLHMKTWNKHHPKQGAFDATNQHKHWMTHPLGVGHIVFNTLEDQAQWIAYVRAWIHGRQSGSYLPHAAEWKKLELDFDLPEVIGTITAVS